MLQKLDIENSIPNFLNTRYSVFHTVILIIVVIILSFTLEINKSYSINDDSKKNITLTLLFEDLGDPQRWEKWIIQPSMEELKNRHPELNLKYVYKPLPYQDLRNEIIDTFNNKSKVDVITIDPTWLGELVEKGILYDLSPHYKEWKVKEDIYQVFMDTGVYNDGIYGVYIIGDIRSLWYWKDMLSESNVDPSTLKTWDGYLAAAKKINSTLGLTGVSPVHLVGANHSPDIEFYPYLWMLNGDILEKRTGHPEKGIYWFPAYNGTEGIKALSFIKSQVDSGITPQKNHYWGKEFLDRKFAIMIEALQHHIPLLSESEHASFVENIGMLPIFPVPQGNFTSASLLGGWEIGISSASENKLISWELITIMMESRIITPFLQTYGYLPTRISIGEHITDLTNNTVPYYKDLVDMIKIGHTRPNIPEFPEISNHIKEALDDVYYNGSSPKEALDKAAYRSAKTLGW